MPFIQITIAEAHDAATKRALITGVSAAAAADGMPEEAFRVWIVEVSPNVVSANPAHPARDPWVVLADQRAIRRADHPAQRRSARSLGLPDRHPSRHRRQETARILFCASN